MLVKLPERSILDELVEQKDRIIKEGNLYLTYIYSSLSRQPKNIYTFEKLVNDFETLRIVKAKDRVALKGISKISRKQEPVIETRNKNLAKYLLKIQALFTAYKILELENVT